MVARPRRSAGAARAARRVDGRGRRHRRRRLHRPVDGVLPEDAPSPTCGSSCSSSASPGSARPAATAAGSRTRSPGGRERYAKTHGRDAAIAQQRALNDTVDEVIAVAAREGIDADIVKGGELIGRAHPRAARAAAASGRRPSRPWPHTDLELLGCRRHRRAHPRSPARSARRGTRTARASIPRSSSRVSPRPSSGSASTIYEDTRVSRDRARPRGDRPRHRARAVRAARDRGLHRRPRAASTARGCR